ncbi:hypothetical protein AKJ09_03925 [Labilithrix luteola]|uniref:4-vinyl reductase 4VR domain-containing protein n=1 Tax=Labilithrix luteola TaxID=1391654 RepID=A0A0K1PV73_9BACT|nr:hypothetical protein [Labilithrix luteola]AKU97261.1 hypothetical protein AKJ09_03925 [Labilithrix luteola]
MKEFEFGDPSVSISRAGMGPFLAAFGAYQSRGEKVVKRHLGVEELSADPSTRYPLSGYLSAMRELQEQFGFSFIRKMGTLVFEKAVFPPGLDSAAKVLASLNQAFYMNHPNAEEGKIGGYQWKADGDARGIMFCDNPYPCSLDTGILEGITSRFSANWKVSHDEAMPCRAKGGDSCTYVVEW